jgi:hypothetical protein
MDMIVCTVPDSSLPRQESQPVITCLTLLLWQRRR